jgi:PhzF family phenazine biosynthesis protein
MGQPMIQVDAFTDRPFSGNPAAVCVMAKPGPEEWMQDVAREMNLSETAFLFEEGDGFRLRWFTPAVEVTLCGHATLASAHVLWETGRLDAGTTARFFTRSGLLTAVRDGEWIEMDFPAESPVEAEPPAGLLEALGVDAVRVSRNRFDYLIEVADEAAVRACAPDFGRLRAVEARGTIVTSRAAGSGSDFVSRFFAPRAGVDEDPVTGSAHCCLAPYWSARFGRDSLTGYQASRRGGTVGVKLNGSRVALRGKAVTTLRGELSDAASGAS